MVGLSGKMQTEKQLIFTENNMLCANPLDFIQGDLVFIFCHIPNLLVSNQKRVLS